MPTFTGSQLREHRRARRLTQRAFAVALGVTANTVARWERDEVRIPAPVGVLLHAQREAEAEQARARALEGQVKALTWQITVLQVRNLALENKLRTRRATRRVASATRPPENRPPEKAEQIYKRLVRTYHPDRHPDLGSSILASINELWQAVVGSR